MVAAAVEKDQKARNETWAVIDQTLVDTRRKLEEKYKTKF